MAIDSGERIVKSNVKSIESPKKQADDWGNPDTLEEGQGCG